MHFFPKTGNRMLRLVHRLLVCALIEARSCERFRVLSQNLKDPELSSFYNRLMVSEAHHYTLFLGFARTYGGKEPVEDLWKDLLTFEAKIVASFSDGSKVHG
jgi:tRNA 2-(methylsulfanyl)-N6-isopentenyladenosine37 hydroxylase